MKKESEMYKKVVRIRLLESALLSPEFDYLEIGENGLLKKPFLIPETGSYTFDKVYAASVIKGSEYMNQYNNSSLIPYYMGRNMIYNRVLREVPYKISEFELADGVNEEKNKAL